MEIIRARAPNPPFEILYLYKSPMPSPNKTAPLAKSSHRFDVISGKTTSNINTETEVTVIEARVPVNVLISSHFKAVKASKHSPPTLKSHVEFETDNAAAPQYLLPRLSEYHVEIKQGHAESL